MRYSVEMAEERLWEDRMDEYAGQFIRGMRTLGLDYKVSFSSGLVVFTATNPSRRYSVGMDYHYRDGLNLTVRSPRRMNGPYWEYFHESHARFLAVKRDLPARLADADAFLAKEFSGLSHEKRLRLIDGFCGFADLLLNDEWFLEYLAALEIRR